MTTQPALRLADALDLYATGDDHQRDIEQAADELRRLYKSNIELLAALREIDNWLVCACIATPEDMAQSVTHMEQVAQAAIAKAERTTT